MADRREEYKLYNATPERKERMKQWRIENAEKIRQQTKKRHLINHPRRIQFKDKRIQIKEDPRIGICQLCGAVRGMDCKVTHIHHLQYHDDDPLEDTIEVCVSCHRRQHRNNAT